MAWVTNTAPTGWLICNGNTILRSTYSNLFAVIGIIYGSGDGSTTFKIPDYRGAFLRGSGTNGLSGFTTYTGTLNTAQKHATQEHTHPFTTDFASFFNESGVQSNKVAGGSGLAESFGFRLSGTTGNPNTNTTILTDVNESRPFNYGINWVIKF